MTHKTLDRINSKIIEETKAVNELLNHKKVLGNKLGISSKTQDMIAHTKTK